MLQEKAVDRKAALVSSNDYHNFMGMVGQGLAGLVLLTAEKSDY